jgi:CDP-6-deoxy-D-xylo-4-hexulose-3-dehydrase
LKEKYNDKLPNAEFLGENAFYIGCHQYLKDKDITYIVETFEKIFKETA